MIELGIIIAVVLAAWAYIKMSKEKIEESVPVETVEEVATVEPSVEEDVPVETVEEVTAVESSVEEDVPVETVEEVTAVEPSVEEDVPVETVAEVELSEIEQGIPEDSMLKRHYLQTLAAEQGGEINTISSNARVRLPEDVVLKRHFIQKVTTDIAEQLADRPSDSTLVRHYDTQLASLVNQRLQELK